MFNEIVVGVQRIASGVVTKARGGREGQQIVGHLHGKYGEAAMGGQIFCASTLIVGVVLPVAAATLNSKWTLYNPANSGVNVEIISFSTGMDTATQVVNGIGLMIQRNLSGGAGVPTLTTSAAALPMGIGGTNKATAWAQATLTNVAIPGVTAATAVPIAYVHCFTMGATTAAGVHAATRDFDGALWLEPDSLVAAVTTVAGAAQNQVSMVWAEYPI